MWFWFPDYIFQALSSFAFVTWIAPNNQKVNTIFGVGSIFRLLVQGTDSRLDEQRIGTHPNFLRLDCHNVCRRATHHPLLRYCKLFRGNFDILYSDIAYTVLHWGVVLGLVSNLSHS